MLTRRTQIDFYCLSLTALCGFVFALMVYLAPGVHGPDAIKGTAAILHSGLRQLSWYIFLLIGTAAAFMSHLIFTGARVKLTATFLGSAIVLYILAIPELWSMSNDATALCTRRAETGANAPPVCLDIVSGLTELFAFTLFIWSINIVLPVAAGVTLIHGWFMLCSSFLRGARARLRA